jgi:hypothetical protein
MQLKYIGLSVSEDNLRRTYLPRFEDFIAANIKVAVFCVAPSCSLIEVYRRFRGLHGIQGTTTRKTAVSTHTCYTRIFCNKLYVFLLYCLNYQFFLCSVTQKNNKCTGFCFIFVQVSSVDANSWRQCAPRADDISCSKQAVRFVYT